MIHRLIAVAGIAATIALAAPAAAQTADDDARFRAAQERFDREYQIFRQEADRYQAARRVPAAGGYRTAPDRYDPRVPYAYDDGYQDDPNYDAARYYRSGSQYRERALSNDERVYRGYDGQYYCQRSDGTTGLIVGAAAGGILGNVIDGGRSRIVGTLLGGAGGALAGRAIEQNSQVRCR